MTELIYSIQNIFNSETSEGCLYQYEVQKYHIPAYQRGYKWGSEHENDPVPMLLNDLYTNFKNNPDKKYYLQYITLSKKDKKQWLEVIDGQQRLTTLSILISVFNTVLLLDSNSTTAKLDYAIRPDIFDEHIYPKEALKIFLNQDWTDKGILLNGIESNNQDVYYIFHAAKRISTFLSSMEDAEEFHNYVMEKVMLIVNSVEAHIPGEKVFRNLNSNKVPLTEVDLIKGLLLTRVARFTVGDNQKKTYREVLENRTSLGKQWDEIAIGVNEPAFSDFYFEENKGLHGLVELVAQHHGYEPSKDEKHYPVFNFYNKHINDIHLYFEDLKIIYGVLRNWYNDTKLYNLLGFIFHARGTKINKRQILKGNVKSGKKEFIVELLEKRKTTLPENTQEAVYGESDNTIHNVLLALNVFSNEVSEYRYSFYNHKKHNWTLEHIFPQSPEGRGRTLNAEQKAIIKAMLGGDLIDDKLNKLLKKEDRTKDEKAVIYEALKSIGELNSIGNMALLSDSNNSSIGCGLFDEKRTAVLNFIERGDFVPIHTFSVFSKSIFDTDPGNLLAWDKANITEHQKIIESKICKLREETVEL